MEITGLRYQSMKHSQYERFALWIARITYRQCYPISSQLAQSRFLTSVALFAFSPLVNGELYHRFERESEVQSPRFYPKCAALH